MANPPKRPVRFELHILPMMRLIDRDHMIEVGLDLFSYDTVKARAQRILDRLRDRSDSMPPLNYGGPWPEEWIALFQRWKDEGFLRLGSATAKYRATRDGELVTLTASGMLPNQNDVAWFDRRTPGENPREYTLWVETPVPPEPGEVPFDLEETFRDKVSRSIVVHDAAGRHEIPIQ